MTLFLVLWLPIFDLARLYLRVGPDRFKSPHQ
jgi:hypothetical protein